MKAKAEKIPKNPLTNSSSYGILFKHFGEARLVREPRGSKKIFKKFCKTP